MQSKINISSIKYNDESDKYDIFSGIGLAVLCKEKCK